MHLTTRSQSVALSLFLVGALLLSGCGGSTKKSASACTQQYWNGQVGVCIPAGWEVMERERLSQFGVPPEVVVAFQTAKPVAGQYPNVLITKEALAQPVTSTSYSDSAVRTVGALPGYQLIDMISATVEQQDVKVHVYSAQPLADQARSRFYQISAVAGGTTGYSVTGFAPLSVSDSLGSQILTILKSLTFTEPAAAE